MTFPKISRPLCLLLLAVSPVGGAPVVELTVEGEPHRGRPVAHNREVCWLASRDGTLQEVPLSEVSAFRKAGDGFRGLTTVEMRTELRQTWGRRFEILARGPYVVCAPHGKGAAYADLLDRVSRSFHGYFSRRGFQLPALEYPLVVLVFPSQVEFLNYCRSDEVPPSPTLRGYYHTRSNRVALYDDDSRTSGVDHPPGVRDSADVVWAKVDGGNRNVLVHEAVHQLAFNYGLHSRIGQNPRWLVEGLATMLEVEDARSSGKGTGSRVNRERLEWFRAFRRERGPEALGRFLTDDETLFRRSPLDAYSQAWALTFFLAETRSSDCFRYLKLIGSRDPLSEEYSPQERLHDFQTAFGNDLARLDVQFLRFIDGLE